MAARGDMAKITRRTNFRVVVRPRPPGDFGYAQVPGLTHSEERTLRICQEIADQIRRHVDNLPTPGRDRNRGVQVTWDTEDYCSHCAGWWETEPDGRPVCCQEAIDEWAQADPDHEDVI